MGRERVVRRRWLRAVRQLIRPVGPPILGGLADVWRRTGGQRSALLRSGKGRSGRTRERLLGRARPAGLCDARIPVAR
eukprot:5644182-Pyramimonas_sp.AAC.1